ncbi:TetR/AcrR family transcriptional regulator [Runella sp. MFBS21]|uniref:TetR/AcrR family transcriptional regulator n=1 Tax=Runella sp. MFBS21 TaxID=3034018 RepID=UPI0023F98FFB|nr:TetR/AcrR family transcriptional regulator [Runella sp. MFBS21]MDF7817844.1 TetR/AcrR family transcriptional regulator [Runella sp. MFBS21]
MPIQKVTKEEVVRQALLLFKKQGYHRTSMADLAAACGLQKGSFYHYFPSKDALMSEVLKLVHSYFKEKVFPIAYDESLSPRQRLEKMISKKIKIVASTEGGCLMGNMAIETALVTDEFLPQMQVFFEEYLQVLSHVYAYKYTSEEAQKLAEQAVVEYEGAWIMVKLTGKSRYLEDVLQRAVYRFDTHNL